MLNRNRAKERAAKRKDNVKRDFDCLLDISADGDLGVDQMTNFFRACGTGGLLTSEQLQDLQATHSHGSFWLRTAFQLKEINADGKAMVMLTKACRNCFFRLLHIHSFMRP